MSAARDLLPDASARAAMQHRQPRAADLIAVPARIADVAARQAGVLTRLQLRSAGFTAGQLEAAIRAGRWRAIGRNVVVLDNAPLSSEQRRWTAVLLPGKPCALAGASGAEAAGLKGFEPDRVHVVVRHATHVRAPAWVKLHESRRFSAADIVAAAGPPQTSVARSVIDAAAWSPFPRFAAAVVCAAVQQRLTTAAELQRQLATAGRVRHAALLRDVLGDVAGGGHTLAEIDLGPLAERAGLGRPRRQGVRHDPDGRARFLDAEFVLPDGTVLVVEIDGQGHMEVETWEDDLERQNEITIERRPTLRFASLTVRLRPAVVVDQLSRMRAAHDPSR